MKRTASRAWEARAKTRPAFRTKRGPETEGHELESTLHAIALWMHILGIALFVGPQFFLAFAWPAAARGMTDLGARTAAAKTLTRRFGYIGGVGLVLILMAGTYLIATWRDYYAQPGDIGFNDLRYGVVFSAKMGVLAVMLVVVGLHTFKVGPGLVREMEAEAAGAGNPEALRRARMMSRGLSSLGLLLTLAIMVMGALLTTTNFSMHEV